MAITKMGHLKYDGGKGKKHLYRALRYISNPDKTENGLWIGSNCGDTTDMQYEKMMSTKRFFGKEKGRQAYHFVLSWSPNEVVPNELAYKVAREFCERYLGNNYEYVFAIHDDQPHKHVHIIFNSLNQVTGLKYRYVAGDWEKYIQPLTDEICEKNGLAKLVFEEKGERIGKSYYARDSEKKGKWTWKNLIRADIDYAISVSNSMDDYFKKMKSMGYRIGRRGRLKDHGEYITYHAPEKDGSTQKKGTRDRSLGEGYTLKDIEARIAQNETTPRTYIVEAPQTITKASYLIIRREIKLTHFQLCAVNRIKQMNEFHFLDLNIREQGRARYDLLRFDRIMEEMQFILDHDLQSASDVNGLLTSVKQELKKEYNKKESADAVGEVLTESEIEDSRLYNELLEYVSENEYELSDEEFEEKTEEIETLFDKYADKQYVLRPPSGINTERIRQLKDMRRVLRRIAKDVNETVAVRDVPYLMETSVQIVPQPQEPIPRA